MKIIVLISIVLGSILISGCSQKEIQYVNQDLYEFQKIDLRGAYIEMPSKEIQKTCTPSLLELNEIYSGVVKFYDAQIDDYTESIKKTLEKQNAK